MKYEMHDKWNDMDFGGSALVGMVFSISRKHLVDLLGEPTQVNGTQIKERWLIKFEDGTIGTIFNDQKTKDGEWCVGGFGQYDKKTKENLSFRAVKELLNQ